MTTIWDTREKSGQGWEYNEPNMAYNSENDPDGGSPVYYNQVGSATVFTNQTKN